MRKLRAEELQVVQALLLSAGDEYRSHLKKLKALFVEDLNDGGMGSLRFLPKDKRIRFQTIAEAEFLDKDHVSVFLCLDVDVNGALFELGSF